MKYVLESVSWNKGRWPGAVVTEAGVRQAPVLPFLSRSRCVTLGGHSASHFSLS